MGTVFSLMIATVRDASNGEVSIGEVAGGESSNFGAGDSTMGEVGSRSGITCAGSGCDIPAYAEVLGPVDRDRSDCGGAFRPLLRLRIIKKIVKPTATITTIKNRITKTTATIIHVDESMAEDS